jgi:hypothetical protein
MLPPLRSQLSENAPVVLRRCVTAVLTWYFPAAASSARSAVVTQLTGTGDCGVVYDQPMRHPAPVGRDCLLIMTGSNRCDSRPARWLILIA